MARSLKELLRNDNFAQRTRNGINLYVGLRMVYGQTSETIGSAGVGRVTTAPGTREVDAVERPNGFAMDHQLTGYFLHCDTVAHRSL